MYNILIVDDESIEREGISYLIEEKKLPLKVFEAPNGEEALPIIRQNDIHILLTDIKMPFMDGLQLADAARKLRPDIKIIIFSAYGEFDYAKQAINLEVMDYLLKPVKIKEFESVMTKIIESCREEDTKREKEEILNENLGMVSQYMKEKFLVDLVSSSLSTDVLDQKIKKYVPGFHGRCILPVLVDIGQRFFDQHNELFKSGLEVMFKYKDGIQGYEYININEYQGIILLLASKPDIYRGKTIKDLCNQLIQLVKKISSVSVCIVAGRASTNLECLHSEFEQMEQMAEYKFFYDDSVVLFTDHEAAPIGGQPVNEERIMENFYRLMDSYDFENAEKCIDLFFTSVRNAEGYSAIYFKYLCIEICKKLMEISKESGKTLQKEFVEEIFKADTFYLLREMVSNLIRQVASKFSNKPKEVSSSVIKDVLVYIHENYANDIGLEMAADKVYISPSYLSILFKKEAGQSFIKYLVAYRLEKATELLKNTNLKVADISRKVGFFNYSYFCMVFRNTYGVSPLKYRGGDE